MVPIRAAGTVPELKLLALSELIMELVTYPAPFVIALLLRDIFDVPLNETPAIVLAVAKAVAVAALPEVF